MSAVEAARADVANLGLVVAGLKDYIQAHVESRMSHTQALHRYEILLAQAKARLKIDPELAKRREVLQCP